MSKKARPVIGILALQGDFEAHKRAVEGAGGDPVEVRTKSDLDHIDGLIIPGGESTTMLKMLAEEDLFEPLRQFGRVKPVFGTCAGAILLAKEVLNPPQNSLQLMDLVVERNAYGRQIDSRIAHLEFGGEPLEAVFIRAPVIRKAGGDSHVLVSYNGDPVLVEQGRHMASTFHPELAGGAAIHRLFVEKVSSSGKRKIA
jgi:5'-phosphate synthase pdxT subunit